MLGLELQGWQAVSFNWAVVTVVICGVTYYYGGFDNFITKYRPESQAVLMKEPREKPTKNRKPKKKPDGIVTSGTESGSAIDSGKNALSKVAKNVVAAVTTGADQKRTLVDADDEDTSRKANMEFARSLSKAKVGTDFSSSKKNGTKSRVRTVKSKLADEGSSHESATTSSTGQDGDDETSRTASPAVKPTTSVAEPGHGMLDAQSPEVRTTSSEEMPDTTGVGDMLEPANNTFKTISLVGDFTQVQSKKQKSAAKAPEPTESKKQRQQRRKREEEKERIAQSNKEHEAKREQQMRGARIAEGTSNQTKANAFKSPENVWTSSSQTKGSDMKQPGPNAASSTAVAPLDTFESKSVEKDGSHGAVTAQSMSQVAEGQSQATVVNGLKKELGTQRTSALAASEREKASETHYPLQRTESWADQMDEEEQIKLAREDSQKWESVVTKKDKKKVRKVDTDTNGDSTKRTNGQATQTAAVGKANGASSKQQSKATGDNRYGSLFADPTSNDAQDEAHDETWEA